jgi:hypothetical protein
MEKHIGEIMIEEGLITKRELEEAVNLQKNNKILLGEALMTLNVMTKETLSSFLKKHRDEKDVDAWIGEFLTQKEIDKLFGKDQ